MLEASLMYGGPELADAISDHRAVQARSPQPAARRRHTGEGSRLNELKRKPGWAWLRVFRRYDDFQAALAQAESEEKARNAEVQEPVG
jgi:hypothetical protein